MEDPPTLLSLLRRSTDYLAQRGIENARREAEWLFVDRLKLSRLDLYTRFDMLLDEHETGALREVIVRRGRREPLAYILGTQPFCGLELTVTPAVLVPRPETEELVALVMAEVADCSSPMRLIDVGTGSGAIALALKQALPKAEVWAVDISEAALAVAQSNAERHQLLCHFEVSDLLTAAPGPWQVVAVNLPYIGEDERDRCDPELAFEPSLALFSGADGLDLCRRLLAQLVDSLAPGGCAWLEHGDLQAAALAALCPPLGLASRCQQDQQGKDRFTRIWVS